MEKIVIKNDLSVFDGRLNAIKPALLLLQVLSFLRNKQNNTIKISREELLEVLKEDDKVPCDRIVRYWRQRLEWHGAIKYHASTYVINPRYIFEGDKDDYTRTVAFWNNFPADNEPKFDSQIAV